MNPYCFDNIAPDRRCTAYINLEAIKHNFDVIAQLVAPSKVIAVVKANAYGHGAVEVARALSGRASLFAVATCGEAIQLRQANICDLILILGHVEPSLASHIALHNIEITVHTLEHAYLLSSQLNQGQRLNVHIKLDTGMSRLGFAVSDTASILKLWDITGINPVGLFTHFAAADSIQAEDKLFTAKQYERFVQVKEYLHACGKDLLCHVSNSAASMHYPEFRENAVRTGILLYGLSPSPMDKQLLSKLKPAMVLKAQISEIKKLRAGSCISYGRTYRANKDITVATISAGYADGYPRALSSQGSVSIKECPATILGRICMDQLMVDVSAIKDIHVGDEVTLFGGNSCADSIDDIAAKCNTISYEIVTGISSRVSRCYL